MSYSLIDPKDETTNGTNCVTWILRVPTVEVRIIQEYALFIYNLQDYLQLKRFRSQLARKLVVDVPQNGKIMVDQ